MLFNSCLNCIFTSCFHPCHCPSADPGTCVDIDGNVYLEGDSFYTIENIVSGMAVLASADVIFVVDESGSMLDAQEWVMDVAQLLDDALQLSGIGVGGQPNLFALVGFGRSNPESIGGTVLSQLVSVPDFVAATSNLFTNGSTEDGYSAIEVALDQVQLREGMVTARIMVLATDEDRTALIGKEGLQRDEIEQQLQDQGFILNVVVKQGFLYDASDPSSLAFGINFNGTAYTYDPDTFTDVITFPNGVADPNNAFGNTYEDYVQLAFNLEGAAWDIDFISQSLDLTGFSQSFTEAKVEEVMGLMQKCFACTCLEDDRSCQAADTVALENCEGPTPPVGEFVFGFLHL